jgi:molecular chaperone GrpE
MTDRTTDSGEGGRRPRVKVTDRRRAHAGGSEVKPGEVPEEGIAQGEGRARAPSEGASTGHHGDQDAGTAQGEGRARAPSEGAPTGPQSEAAEYLADLQRLKAEYDNYRKRVLREQTRAVEFATEGLVVRLLEVLDEFELALAAAERDQEAPGRFVHGVHMVYAKLLELLKAEGLERIDAEGAPFDPELHEALLQGEGPEDGESYVADVLRTGYRLKGRVVRPAGVKVARR